MIRVDRDGDFWTLTIDRPAKANSLTRAMLVDLADAAEAAHGHANVLLITGTGSVFSAGMDLEDARNGLSNDPVWERLSAALAALPCLTIAALNGTLAGGAFGMALACDLRLAVPEAKFFYPVMKMGFRPQPSDPVRLVSLVGPARAKLILMAGQKISAAEALDWGLIDRVVTAGSMAEEVVNLTEAVLSADPDHVAAIKLAIT